MRTGLVVVVGTVGFLASVTSILTWAGITMEAPPDPPTSSYSPTFPTTSPEAMPSPNQPSPNRPTQSRPTPSPPVSTSTAAPVVCAIRDRLGPGQLDDTVAVTVGTRSMRPLTASATDPVDTLRLRARRAGSFTYRLASRTTVAGAASNEIHTGYGTGRFWCRAGAVYEVVVQDDSTEPWTLTLVPQ